MTKNTIWTRDHILNKISEEGMENGQIQIDFAGLAEEEEIRDAAAMLGCEIEEAEGLGVYWIYTDNPMKQISINNGNTFCTVQEALDAVNWDIIVSYMDDETREQVHDELAPCSESQFLVRYLQLAKNDLILG